MQTALFEIGKLPGQSVVATGVTGQFPSRLFFIMDRSSGCHLLVDTGAEVSVLPSSFNDRKQRQEGCNLLAVNGSPINTFGKRSLTLDLGLRRTFRWVFIIANVQSPILRCRFPETLQPASGYETQPPRGCSYTVACARDNFPGVLS